MTRNQFFQLLSGLLLQARQKAPVSDDAAFAHAKATYLTVFHGLESVPE